MSKPEFVTFWSPCKYVNGMVCRVVAPIWKIVLGKSYILKIQGFQGSFSKFKDFSRISRTCLKFKDFKDFFKDVVTLTKEIYEWTAAWVYLLLYLLKGKKKRRKFELAKLDEKIPDLRGGKGRDFQMFICRKKVLD